MPWCAFPVAFAARHRAQRSTAQSEQIGKRGNERHKGKAQADTCQRKRALAGDFADINAVYNIIQQVEQLRDEHRCGHSKYPAADAALRKINLLQTNTVLSKSEKSREKSELLLHYCNTAADFRQESSKISARYSISHAVRRSSGCSGSCACAAVSTEARSNRAIAGCAQSCGEWSDIDQAYCTPLSVPSSRWSSTTPASAVVMVFSPRISLTPETVA